MDKKAVLNELIRVYDENAELKNKLKNYEIAAAASRGIGELGSTDGLAPITVMCIDAGRRTLWDKVIDKYHLGRKGWGNEGYEYYHDNSQYPLYVKGYNDEGKPTYVFLTYDQWVKTLNFGIFEDNHSDQESKFYFDCIKQYSMNDLLTFFSAELHEVYDSLVNSKKMQLLREAKNNG